MDTLTIQTTLPDAELWQAIYDAIKPIETNQPTLYGLFRQLGLDVYSRANGLTQIVRVDRTEWSSQQQTTLTMCLAEGDIKTDAFVVTVMGGTVTIDPIDQRAIGWCRRIWVNLKTIDQQTSEQPTVAATDDGLTDIDRNRIDYVSRCEKSGLDIEPFCGNNPCPECSPSGKNFVHQGPARRTYNGWKKKYAEYIDA